MIRFLYLCIFMSYVFSLSALDTIEQAIYTSNPSLLSFLEETPEYTVTVSEKSKNQYIAQVDETITKYKKALSDPLLTSAPSLIERYITLLLTSSAFIYITYMINNQNVRLPVTGLFLACTWIHSIFNFIQIIKAHTTLQPEELLKKAQKIKEVLTALPASPASRRK